MGLDMASDMTINTVLVKILENPCQKNPYGREPCTYDEVCREILFEIKGGHFVNVYYIEE